MKRDFDNLDLRGAFRDEPEKCHRALMDTVRSLQVEETKTMKTPFRTLLIAAIIILSTLTVAFAASEVFGLTDFFRGYGIVLNPSTQQAMQPDEETAFQVGPLTFTVQERVADPYFAYISTKISTTDGSQALIAPDDVYDRIGASAEGKALAAQLGIDYKLTWLEAAAKLDWPLYAVRAIMEPDESISNGPRMEDILWDARNNAVFINQTDLYDVAAGTELSLQLFLRVAQIDPTIGEQQTTWSIREPYTIPVNKLLAKGRYLPEEPLTVSDMTLTFISAELYSTGMHVFRNYEMPEGMARDINYPVWEITDTTPMLDATGAPFPQGISLTGSYHTYEWPTVTVTNMFNVDKLPESIQVGGILYALTTD